MNKETDNQIPSKSPFSDPLHPPVAKTGRGVRGVWTWIRKILTGLVYALGFGKDKIKDSGCGVSVSTTFLAHQRTDLAMDRSYLAAERTLMAWIRTSLSMISFGFTIGKLGQVMEDVQIKGIMGVMRRTVSVEAIAYFLVILGTVALIGAAIQYRNRVRELCAMGMSRQFSIAFIIAILLAAVGAFALSSLVLAL
jgi:putative membrane protein